MLVWGKPRFGKFPYVGIDSSGLVDMMKVIEGGY